jgi:hypothetical protein
LTWRHDSIINYATSPILNKLLQYVPSKTLQTRRCSTSHLDNSKKWRIAISPLKWRGCNAPRLAFDKLLSTSLLQFVPNKTLQTRRCSTSPLDNSKKWRIAISPLKWRGCSAPRPAFDKLLATSLLQVRAKQDITNSLLNLAT